MDVVYFVPSACGFHKQSMDISFASLFQRKSVAIQVTQPEVLFYDLQVGF